MGGIAGQFHLGIAKPVDPARLHAMSVAQAHRGPEGGIWTWPGAGLAQRYRGVADGDATPQPTRIGASAVAWDGDIDNGADLRRRLEAGGARFATSGIGEVLLHGWRAWGTALLDRLHGEFALAIHDGDAGTLCLARDRLGVKPLHWAELPDGSLAFASELKGLLVHPLLRRLPDLLAVDDYLAFGYVPDDACLVAGVRKLAAGHLLLVQRGRPLPQPRRWWDVSFADRATGSADALGEQLLQHMREAVRSRMNATAPAAALSGDVADAAIVALMAEASTRAVRTCTIERGDAGDHGAAEVAQRFASDHHAYAAWTDADGLADALVRQYDEPCADPQALIDYQAAQLAAADARVMLSGAGSEAILAGDPHHAALLAQQRVRALLPGRWRTIADGWHTEDGWAASATRLVQAMTEEADRAYAGALVTPPAVRRRLFSADAARTLSGYHPEHRVLATMRAAPARDAIDRAQYADIHIGVPGLLLTRMDRTGMAAGLEVRLPMLDHRLVEFCATLPLAMRLRRGRGRWLMTRSLAAYLPAHILRAPQPAAKPPIADWLRGVLANAVAALPRSRASTDLGWFDPAVIAQMADDHRGGRGDHTWMLWRLVMLDRSIRHLFG